MRAKRPSNGWNDRQFSKWCSERSGRRTNEIPTDEMRIDDVELNSRNMCAGECRDVEAGRLWVERLGDGRSRSSYCFPMRRKLTYSPLLELSCCRLELELRVLRGRAPSAVIAATSSRSLAPSARPHFPTLT